MCRQVPVLDGVAGSRQRIITVAQIACLPSGGSLPAWCLVLQRQEQNIL